ncbi:CHAD domain-containing protein [Paraconexibacter sp.]|uniref:CYTH and CHAD domain-containing protein n=1 Tax=Paraconexibacter sp. TaxID=2949640 RepID=UPI0035663999
MTSGYVLPTPLDLSPLEDALKGIYGLRVQAAARRTWTALETFDGRIAEAGLELVHEDGRLVLSEADGREVASAPHGRLPGRLLLADLPEGPLREALREVIDVRALTPVARVSDRDRLLRVLDDQEKTVVRLHAEEPEVEGVGALSPRLRVESVRGYDKAAARVGAVLQEVLELVPVERSLWDEAVVLGGGAPARGLPGVGIDLRPGVRADRAAARICRRLLDVVELNLPGTLNDVDPEFLHDFRVAVRRTRALQRELRGVFPPEELEHWRAEFKWLQAVTGPSRDLDVYVLEFDDFRAALPQARRADLAPLHDLLVRRRAAALRRMRRALRSARTTQALRGWAEVLRALEDGTACGPDGHVPVGDLASVRISKVYRQMVKAGREIHDGTPADALHDLRKKGKELRYLLEFFASLYPKDVVKPMVSTLKALQDTLGRFQDREVQADLVGSLADDIVGMDDGTTALMAMGLLVERLHTQQEEARSEFAERFGRFAAKDQRAIVEETFR